MIRGVLFDLNGTLIDILTDESRSDIYRTLANLLDYHGASITPESLKEYYWALNKKVRHDSSEKYPEFDVVGIFRQMLADLAPQIRIGADDALPRQLAETFRAAARVKLQLYPGVRTVLKSLYEHYTMGAVSDGQSIWAWPELRRVGLEGYFSCVYISSDYGYRKPDPRFYKKALHKLKLQPEEVVFVGNDMFRDVWGAHQLGMKTVFFQSNQGDWTPAGAEPDFTIKRFDELPRALAMIKKQMLPKGTV